MGSCVVMMTLECCHEDQMSAGRLKRVGLEECIHYNPFLVLSFSLQCDKF